jgi:hypothetical protein
MLVPPKHVVNKDSGYTHTTENNNALHERGNGSTTKETYIK